METWQDWEGRVIDQKFPLRQYLGGSADCAVFLTDFAEQKATIKLCSADAEDAEHQLSLWERTAGLSHPHLMRLLQKGRCLVDDRDLLYVVTEHAEETLSQVLPDRPLTPAEARDLTLNILDALEYLHGNGLVHGRIKPANIVAVDNQLKISSDRLSRIGEVRASPGKLSVYDAPEIVGTGLSPAADVWSLGMTLVECLTQHPLLHGTTGDLLVPDTLPPPFFDIASHCLLRDPQRRYTVAEIKERLQPEPAIRPETVPSAPAMPSKRPNKTNTWSYLIPLAAGLMIVTVLALPKLRRLRPETAPSPTAVSAPSAATISTPSASSVPAPSSSTMRTPSPSSVPEQPAPKSRGVGSIRGAVVHQAIPEVPSSARDTIRGTVRVVVRVTVDTNGSVVETKFDSPGPSKYFSQQALQAARQWRFRAPTVDGQNVSSEWVLRFNFDRAATTVAPVEVTR